MAGVDVQMTAIAGDAVRGATRRAGVDVQMTAMASDAGARCDATRRVGEGTITADGEVLRPRRLSGWLQPRHGRLRRASPRGGIRHTGRVSYRRRNVWLLSPSLWTAVGLLCGLEIWISMIDHGHQLWRVLAYQVLIWNGWFVLYPVIGWLARRVPMVPPTARGAVVHTLAALVIAPIHSAWWAMLLVEMRPYDAMGTRDFLDGFGSIVRSGLPLQLGVYCGIVAANYAMEFYEKYTDRERTAARLEVSLSEARLHALELQIQPHFLFNTLNSISALVRTSRDREAVTMIAGLSDLLRYSLDHAGEQRVALAQELAVIERYLEIERLRFPDRVAFEIEVPAAVRRAAVPALLLQPLVENAIKHGVAASAEPVTLTVRAEREGSDLVIVVANSGPLSTRAAQPDGFGIGIANVRTRLAALYGDKAGIECGPRPEGGWLNLVRVPWEERSDHARPVG